jgi:uncharacterized protein (TIGR01777 family)
MTTSGAGEGAVLRVGVTGASGLIGRALCATLAARGHTVRRFVRGGAATGEGAIRWDPMRGELDAAALESLDAVVHLAGESVAESRWTESQKARIRESRVAGTSLLARALAASSTRPRVFVSASAVGFYGDTGERMVDESAPRGAGFLAEVCEAWERSADPARDAGVRVVHPRIGVVLAPEGGALAKLLPVFRMGAGGRIGDGRQGFPWVAIDDVVGALQHALRDDTLHGPVNLVAPARTTNADFTRALATVLSRPAFLPVPGFALRAALGPMADEALLQGQLAEPRVLREHGYSFAYPELLGALRHVLAR